MVVAELKATRNGWVFAPRNQKDDDRRRARLPGCTSSVVSPSRFLSSQKNGGLRPLPAVCSLLPTAAAAAVG